MKQIELTVPGCLEELVRIPNADRFTEMYETHAPACLRLAFLMTGDPDDAQDVVHDAFVRVFARFANRRSPDTINAYLRKTIVNLVKDRERRKSRLWRWVQRRDREVEWVEMPDVALQLSIRLALQSLPPRQRAAVVLRHLEDLSVREIADILSCSDAAVKHLLQRGLRILRQGEMSDGL